MSITRAQQAKIHIARQELCMDDDSYRAVLKRIAGVHSSSQLSSKTATTVLDELVRLGWKPKKTNPAKGKPHNFNSHSMPVMMTKVEALLADMNLSWAYVDAIANQMFGIQRCAWLRSEKQLKALIAALDKEQIKRSMSERIMHLYELLGIQIVGSNQSPIGKSIKQMQVLLDRLEHQLLLSEGS